MILVEASGGIVTAADTAEKVSDVGLDEVTDSVSTDSVTTTD